MVSNFWVSLNMGGQYFIYLEETRRENVDWNLCRNAVDREMKFLFPQLVSSLAKQVILWRQTHPRSTG